MSHCPPTALKLRLLQGMPRAAAFCSPPAPSPSAAPASSRPALTLIEMLVALAVTLVMMAAVVNLFANLSGSIRNRRAMIEASAQLRQVRQRMQLDLAGATCAARPWIQPAENRGYIEYIEGIRNDYDSTSLTIGPGQAIDPATSLIPGSQVNDPDAGLYTDAKGLGDHDDILALTVRSQDDPFRAQALNPVTGNIETVESQLAEVLWFAVENPPASAPPNEPGMRSVYRRVALIAPWLGPWPAGTDPTAFENISVRIVGGQVIANTLGDLTKREYRLEHRGNYPFEMSNMGSSTATQRLLLSDALAFDVRAFDPGAPLFTSAGGTVVQPGDPGWELATRSGTAPSSYGAYVDLGWAHDRQGGTPNLLWPPGATQIAPVPSGSLPVGAAAPVFHVPHHVGWHPYFLTVGMPALVRFPATYDTWPYHYENDGADQESLLASNPNYSGLTPPPQFAPWQLQQQPQDTNGLDQGTNGLDDDGINGVDDVGERETAPPYDVPLPGLQVRFRIYERDARQIREASVTHNFTP